jgi:nephrocystin-3
MPYPERQVRVFISSTFRDMHAERDHLVTVVFPELRERVESLGLEFFDVDLRWGVPETGVDGEKANSWEYCRRWIDRVEPFFVCMLGQRYGWVPKPHEIKDDAPGDGTIISPAAVSTAARFSFHRSRLSRLDWRAHR